MAITSLKAVTKERLKVNIEYFYGFMKKCYVTLENDKIINADNYRAFAE